jgi:hypothetical protein
MSRWEPDFDAAVASGVDPYDQAIRLWDLAGKCLKACAKVRGRKLVACNDACKGLEAQANWYSANKSAISDAIGPDVKPLPPGQKASDQLYGSTYMNANGKSGADLDSAIQQLLDDIANEGMTPARRAMLAALSDVKTGVPSNPPLANAGPFPPPHRKAEEPEQPEI